jgi:hypothetical protein
MIEMGLIIPTTPEEVELAENAMSGDHSADSQKPLVNPADILNASLPKIVPNSGEKTADIDASAAANLARAAREGKTITPEIEAKMKEDRDNAERDGEN